jgi:CRISPR system Cascade subunit CasB
MPEDNESTHPFVKHLESLKEDRGALAALRRGLGNPPGQAPEMFPYVIPYLPAETERWREEAYFMIASLYALHPSSIQKGNLGGHFASLRGSNISDQSLERRFTALLSAHRDDLSFYLRQAISYLRSKEQPVNWHQLLRDVMSWGHPDRYVQMRWARSFWAVKRESAEISDTE